MTAMNLLTRTTAAERPERSRLPKRRAISSHRVAVIFSDGALDWLNDQAQHHNTAVADIIRRIIDETRGSYFVSPKR